MTYTRRQCGGWQPFKENAGIDAYIHVRVRFIALTSHGKAELPFMVFQWLDLTRGYLDIERIFNHFRIVLIFNAQGIVQGAKIIFGHYRRTRVEGAKHRAL